MRSAYLLILSFFGLAKAQAAEPVDWKAIDDAWKTSRPLADSGKSTSAQRMQAKTELEKAVESAKLMAEQGQISHQEADLLAAEAETMRRQIYRNPPSDQMVKCYKRAWVPPAQKSFARIEKRLPLVEKLASQGKVHPKALEKIIGTIEKDLKLLSDESKLKDLKGDARIKAIQTRDAMKARLGELRKAR
jgi:hypothetical protein